MLRRIQIINMGPFESFDSGDLPAVVLIEGDNGIGKTGLQACIKWVGESGHDPDILHGNAASGEVIITTDDETQLRAYTTREQTIRSWKPKGGKRWVKGREEIDKIYKAIAYDPLAFLDLKPQKQAEMLASLSPVQATTEEITEAVGDVSEEASAAKIVPGMAGLDVINTIRKTIYDARTTLNVGADTQEKHAAQLEKALPPAAPDGEDWTSTAARLGNDRHAVEMEMESKISQKSLAVQEEKSSVHVQFIDLCAAINQEIDAKIKVLEEERTARKDKVKSWSDTAIEAATAKGEQGVAAVRAEYHPKIETLAADLATARERARAQQESEGTKKSIAAAREDAEQKKNKSARLTSALERLDGLKVKLAGQMKIPGAHVEDGRIVRQEAGGSIPLHRWNTADQMTFCLRLGMMLGGGFVLVDHVEAYTEDNQSKLVETAKAYAEERGVQFILARVDPKGGPLRIVSPNPGIMPYEHATAGAPAEKERAVG